MRLTIQFKKSNDHVILNCIREDGTATIEKLSTDLVRHDFMHYAVESILGLQNSFLGLLAKGHTIQEFELPKEERTKEWPIEAIQTEFIVAFLQLEIHNGKQYEDINAVIQASCAVKEVVPPAPISQDTLDQIRDKARQLNSRWQLIPEGEIMELQF